MGDDDTASKPNHKRSRDDNDNDRDNRRRRKHKSKRSSRDRKSRRRHRSKSKKRRSRSSSYSSGSSSSSNSSSSESSRYKKKSKKSSKSKQPSTTATTAIPSTKLLSKLSRNNETMEEREERKSKRRAARIQARFGYTPEENPFRDPNLHQVFTWKKREEKLQEGVDNDVTTTAGAADGTDTTTAGDKRKRKDNQEQTFLEIEKVRSRRLDREQHLLEMERLRAEESKLKELENYDEWARKEEEFHLHQQRTRSAIRLVEGRERPVDVLAQNLLLFGLSEEEKEGRARVKYRERYNALEELENLETNLEEPYVLLKDLKLGELEELLGDVDAFRRLEREALGEDVRGGEEHNPVIRYWDALYNVTKDEIQFLKTGGDKGTHATLVNDIKEMFQNQPMSDLHQMRRDIEQKLRGASSSSGPRFDENGVVDTEYWQTVLAQLDVHLAKMELSEIHSKMLVRQLEKLEAKREELSKKAAAGEIVEEPNVNETKRSAQPSSAEQASALPVGIEPDFGNLEEELGLDDEIDLHTSQNPSDRYRLRKPRYFNRVKTGYDWNAYNKTHYDHDNPPPKIVQGYKFNIFYPDLIDKTKTPQYFLERADTDSFCILRFSAGPPYEDVAFKIINRQWNKSRKRGFRCTFERGVLSLYFNFQTHWYRR